MILVLTPNPALDLTYTLDHLRPGEVHRVADVDRRPGGKGLNVARVLRALGEEVTVGGFLGRGPGREVRSLLAGTGLTQAWVDIPADARRTVTVVHDGTATALNEAGPPVRGADWDRLAAQVRERARDVVVVSGSMPAGTAPDRLAAVLAAAHDAGARTIVDTSGPHLLTAAATGATLLKPNAEEARAATGAADTGAAARALLGAGARAVAVSLGREGMLLALPGGRLWSARPARHLEGNPTGAGDAAVAALTRALDRAAAGEDLAAVLPAALADAVALSGAAVLRPVAGEVDLGAYERMRPAVTVESRHARC